jgi:TonB family protein
MAAPSTSGGTRADALLALSLSFTAHVVVSFAIWIGEPVAEELPAATGRVTASATASGAEEIDVDVTADGAGARRVGRAAAARGGEAMPRPDSGRAGRGGDGLVLAPAVNLAPRDDRGHLSPALRSRLERAQQARTKTGQKRLSPEDDRVSLDSMLLTFVADGAGRQPDPRRWLRSAESYVKGGGKQGHGRERIARGDEARAMRRGSEREGAVDDRAAPPAAQMAAQMAALRGSDAPSAHARPMTVPGHESSPADERGEQQDDVTAEQEVMARERSWLRASTAGGEQGQRIGGEAGPGNATGAGGRSGPGSRARALGTGRGTGVGIDPADRRRRNYLRRIWGRIDRGWTAADFPKQAALEGKQGYTIVRFVVLANGSVTQARVARGSGQPQFDARMLAVVKQAGPFGPLPPELGPALQHHHEFVVSNPAVRPNR